MVKTTQKIPLKMFTNYSDSSKDKISILDLNFHTRALKLSTHYSTHTTNT